MAFAILVASILILLCIFSSKVLYRFGVPSLMIFLILGMLMGSDGIGGIYFDNFQLAEHVSTIALVLIIFYGGFGTKWDTAKPIIAPASLMSSLGTILTALIIGFFCSWVFNVPLMYGLLFGAVVGSTDAASVFSILRSREMNLKGGLAPLLEVESGSNDPFAYMMTVLFISVIIPIGDGSIAANFIVSFAMQIGIAAVVGAVSAFLAVLVLSRLHLQVTGLYPILLLAIVMLSYSVCVLLGGNGLLCVYILGIVVGNSKILHKVSLVHFFDGLSWIMQILIFFVLGLISFPSALPSLIIPGTILSLIMIFIARPLTTFAIMSWFRTPIRQQLFVAWVGLRGSASIVFAIVAVTAVGYALPFDLFHLVFFFCLFSILIQGTLIPFVAQKLDVVDEDAENSIMKIFTDYYEETHTQLLEYKITDKDSLLGKRIIDANIPENLLIIMIKRGKEVVVPRGSTKLKENDILVVSGDDFSFFAGSV